MSIEIIEASWPCPENVTAFTTVRTKGNSLPPYDALNFGYHVGDSHELVKANEALLQEYLGHDKTLYYLQQTHSDIVINAVTHSVGIEADGIYANQARQVCAVATADCLPILFCDEKGTEVMAIHAGWQGLLNEIIVKGLKDHWQADYEKSYAWLGPAISQKNYEVDDAFYHRFCKRNSAYATAFHKGRDGHWWCDLYAIARMQLEAAQFHNIFGGEYCTFDDDRLFSHRKQQPTGRQLSLLWFD